MRIYLFDLTEWKPDQLPRLVSNFQMIENTINGQLDADNIRDGSLDASVLATNTIQWTVDVPIIGSASSVAASAVGTPIFPSSTVLLDTASIKHLKFAKVIVDYQWAATADGTIQLYDQTANAVRGESSVKTGGESSEWMEFAVSGLVAVNTMRLRANITVAGGAGETVTIYRAMLRLTLGVS